MVTVTSSVDIRHRGLADDFIFSDDTVRTAFHQRSEGFEYMSLSAESSLCRGNGGPVWTIIKTYLKTNFAVVPELPDVQCPSPGRCCHFIQLNFLYILLTFSRRILNSREFDNLFNLSH